MNVLDLIAGWLMDVARWLIIFVLSVAQPSLYSPWTGKVVDIVRPHEIEVEREDGKSERIRLYGVHCPLGDHPFAKEARVYVSDRVLNRKVVVQPLPGKIEGPWYRPKIEPRDSYGRIMALTSVEGESFNRELLRAGIAWWYSPLVPFERGFKRLENIAREEKKGLWSLPNPSPSWDFKATPVGDSNPFQDKILARTPPASPVPSGTKPEAASPERPGAEQEPSDKKAGPETPAPQVPVLPAPDQVVEGPPPEREVPEKQEVPKDECGEREYRIRLARAYRAIVTLVTSHTYICRQIGLNWGERTELARLYALNPEAFVQAEQLLANADTPCPGSVRTHEQVRELWDLCVQLQVLARAGTDNPDAFRSHLENVAQRAEALVQTLNLAFTGY
jgi:endonuclease YncB( thermonuclease family)